MPADVEPGPWGQPGRTDPPERPRGSVPGGSVPPAPSADQSRPGRSRPPAGWQVQTPALPDLLALWRRGFGGGPGGRLPPSIWLRGGRGLGLMGLVVVGLWLSSGFYRVQPDEAGVVQRFGAFVRLTPPGLNYHLPWPIEEVQLPSVTRINRVEIGYRSAGTEPDDSDASSDTGARQVPQESLMLTGDENIIDINFAVFWRISDAAKYVFNTRNPDATIKEVAESVMRQVIGSTPIQPALTDARARIEADVLARAQAVLDRYGTGVQLSQVQLQRVDPPSEVIDSFRDVQRANTEAERMVNEAQSYANNVVPRARGDAAVITAGGDAARQAAVALATGDAKRFESVLEAYQASKDVTLRRLYIEAMQDLLSHAPTTVVDDQMKNLVPLLSLGGRAATSETSEGARP
jgi:membrane protease subunit HflK